jgi:hypothetical protein
VNFERILKLNQKENKPRNKKKQSKKEKNQTIIQEGN